MPSEPKPSAADPARVFTLTVTLDIEQLGILLGQIEGMFITTPDERTAKALAAEIDAAAQNWRPDGRCSEFGYQILRVAPVYRQLLDFWRERCGDAMSYIEDAECLGEFVAALRQARKAVAGVSTGGEADRD
jgi:hypothetical protein